MNFTDYLKGCDAGKLRKFRRMVTEELKKKEAQRFDNLCKERSKDEHKTI